MVRLVRQIDLIRLRERYPVVLNKSSAVSGRDGL